MQKGPEIDLQKIWSEKEFQVITKTRDIIQAAKKPSSTTSQEANATQNAVFEILANKNELEGLTYSNGHLRMSQTLISAELDITTIEGFFQRIKENTPTPLPLTPWNITNGSRLRQLLSEEFLQKYDKALGPHKFFLEINWIYETLDPKNESKKTKSKKAYTTEAIEAYTAIFEEIERSPGAPGKLMHPETIVDNLLELRHRAALILQGKYTPQTYKQRLENIFTFCDRFARNLCHQKLTFLSEEIVTQAFNDNSSAEKILQDTFEELVSLTKIDTYKARFTAQTQAETHEGLLNALLATGIPMIPEEIKGDYQATLFGSAEQREEQTAVAVAAAKPT